jgi:anti-sigma factor ChrR (cupin superfamily)
MTDKTHIQEIEEQAALFALGALEPEDAKRYRARLASGCPLCVSEVQECESVLVGLTLSATPVSPPPHLRSRLLERIGEGAKAGHPANAQGRVVRAQEAPWKPSPFPGVDMRFLHERKTMLVRMAPNTTIPAHPHSAAEQCLVLEGSITSDGLTVHAGDFIYMPAGSSHDDLRSESGALFLITYA